MITATEKIKIILGRNNMTVGMLADRLGMSRQNFSNKLSRANFPEKELQQIADALECDLSITFTNRQTGETI